MLTQNEKEQIVSHLKQKKDLPINLKLRFAETIQAGKKSHANSSDEYLCCDTGLTPPDRYIWTTFDNCRALGGRAADNSMCGH